MQASAVNAGNVIEARDLRVTFRSGKGQVDALAGVSLDIPKGSLFVLLGPNGAGKTTLMRSITALVRPTGGSVTVFGASHEKAGAEIAPGIRRSGDRSADVGDAAGASRAWLRRMGVLIENPGLYARLNTREFLEFFASFYGVPDPEARIRALCADLGLELDAKPIAKLSQGNKQKLHLARSLIHEPELLLWDEPTDHLDPASQREVLQYLQGYLRDKGATALVATHRLEQMESPATHFGFLAHGRLIRAGSREDVLGSNGAGARARIAFAGGVALNDLRWLEAEFGVTALPAPSAVRMNGEAACVEVAGESLFEKIPAIIKALCQREFQVTSVIPHRESLADVYERVMAG